MPELPAPVLHHVVLPRPDAAQLPAQHQGPGLRLQQRDDRLGRRELSRAREQVEEGGGPDDVDLAVHAGEVVLGRGGGGGGGGGFERVDGEEVTVQGAAVEEEVVAEVEELAVDVDAVQAVGCHAVENELTQILREATA